MIRPRFRLILLAMLSCWMTATQLESLPSGAMAASIPAAPKSFRTAAQTSNWTTFTPPILAKAKPLNLWATHYYVYAAENTATGYPLLNPGGDRLGPRLSRHDWCYAALQGTVQIPDSQGVPITYNFAGRGSQSQVDCSPFFSSLSWSTIQKVNRVRFKPATAAYGYGTSQYNLVPYRTIAVDPTRIPIGSVIYIPAAKGVVVTLPSGEQISHDGYFFAADVGSAIKGNHIDVFIGTSKRSPFSFVKSRSSATFQAYLVQDTTVLQTLRSLHSKASK